MRLVIMESPYAGDTKRHRAYARRCLRDCLLRGEAPLASHLLYTQRGVLRDEIAEERSLGIAAGHAWFKTAEACVVYQDLGVSGGMKKGIAAAELAGIPIEYRKIGEHRIPVWTRARLEELARLWMAGASAGTIARELGVSRNAIIGAAHRSGCASRPSPIGKARVGATGEPR